MKSRGELLLDTNPDCLACAMELEYEGILSPFPQDGWHGTWLFTAIEWEE
jgi:hypothetical protein